MRKPGRALFIMCTDEERAALDAMAEDRGVSLRRLVLDALLGHRPTHEERIRSLEQRVDALEFARSGERVVFD